MDNLAENYQKILNFICHMDDVDDLKHLFKYVDDFWQTQFGTSPCLIFSRPKVGSSARLREYWNRGKEDIFYHSDELLIIKEIIVSAKIEESSSFKKIGNTYFYCLNCGVYKGQIFYTCFKIDQMLNESVLDNLYQFLQSTMTKIGRYQEVDTLKSLVHIDDVTGLYNQRKFILDIDNAIKAFEKHNTTFSLVFIDIDHFKKVNDGHGHLVGSQLLKDVSKVISNSVRSGDLCYRYGGDEFVILVPRSTYVEGNIVGKRVLAGIKSQVFEVFEGQGIGNATEFKMTVSIGIASFPKDAKSKVDIINMADKMMYKAKQSGRGMVCSASDLLAAEEEK